MHNTCYPQFPFKSIWPIINRIELMFPGFTSWNHSQTWESPLPSIVFCHIGILVSPVPQGIPRLHQQMPHHLPSSQGFRLEDDLSYEIVCWWYGHCLPGAHALNVVEKGCHVYFHDLAVNFNLIERIWKNACKSNLVISSPQVWVQKLKPPSSARRLFSASVTK